MLLFPTSASGLKILYTGLRIEKYSIMGMTYLPQRHFFLLNPDSFLETFFAFKNVLCATYLHLQHALGNISCHSCFCERKKTFDFIVIPGFDAEN